MATSPFAQPETQPQPVQSQDKEKKLLQFSAPALYHRVQPRRSVDIYSFDQSYVERLASNDAETASHFIRYFTKLLVAKFRAKMNTSGQAEDIAQETLLRVLQYVRTKGLPEHPERLGAFVNAFSEHVLLEFYRQGNRFQQVPENVPDPVEKALDAEMNCITRERKEMIRRELKKLRRGDQVVLEKVFLLEEDKDAICAELKIDRNYLRVQVHRALGRFRKVLEQKRPGGAQGGKNPPAN